jgi:hypothetical protein
MIKVLQKLDALVCAKTQNFWRKYLKPHNIGPFCADIVCANAAVNYL